MQDQWLNIFLLSEFEFSYYSILYFLSGLLFPFIVIKNSINNFLDYKFISNKSQSKKYKYIGLLVILTIIILALLIIRYFIFSLNYIIPQIDVNTYFDLKFRIILLLTVMILLLINKTKRVLKRLLLLNFFTICFINWSTYFFKLQELDIFTNKFISNNSYYEFNNLNILNIFYLFIIELIYYIWSFITYQNNLSDWSIAYPKRVDFIPISKIIIFYMGVLTYYFIFNSII